MMSAIYRGMIGDQNKIPMADVARPAYRPARHGSARRGMKELPIAVAIGWSRHWDSAPARRCRRALRIRCHGRIRGEPVELVKCETNDLMVPASAEIVIEGRLGLILRPI